ncbi:MAG: hypothetical protein JNK87_05055 [Bryobacterales bacterium]|nr:hypothetical protein [Bryobacterales bacterium]
MSVSSLLVFLIWVVALCAQQGTVTTVAGGYPSGDGGPAMRASLNQPGSIALDSKGNLYFLEPNRIRRISPDGMVTTVAGSGFPTGQLGDGGPARLAYVGTIFNSGLVIDAADGVLFADTANNRIRRIAPDGSITTIAGTGGRGFGGDGRPAIEALLNRPIALSAGLDGALYFFDSNNFRIRGIDTSGQITTIAGSGRNANDGDGGNALEAGVHNVIGITADAAGTVYFTVDRLPGFSGVRKVSGAVVSRVGGSVDHTTTGDGGPVESATFFDPAGLRALPDGSILIADGSTVRRIGADGVIELVAGSARGISTIDVTLLDTVTPVGTVPMSAGVRDVLTAPDGSIFFSNEWAGAIFQVNPQREIRRVAGVPLTEGSDGAPQFAKMSPAVDLAFDPQGDLVAVEQSARIARSIPISGASRTTGVGSDPYGIAFRPNGEIFISHAADNVTRRLFGGPVSVFAGTSVAGYSGDGGQASIAQMDNPQALAFDAAGSLYIADQNNHRIRRVSVDGVITTFAGTGRAAFDGDRGPAADASLNAPQGVTVDARGNVYIADTVNRRIRKVDATGIIDTLADPTAFPGNAQPRRVALAPDGSLIVTDSLHRIHRVTATGGTRLIAGTGVPGFSGDGGPATAATFFNPIGVTVDRNGSIYVADTGNRRIRRIAGNSVFAAQPSSLVFAFPLGAMPASQFLTLASLDPGDGDELTFSVSTTAAWLTATPPRGDLTSSASVTITTTANPAGLTKGRYGARVVITSSRGDRFEVPVTMTVSGTPQQLRAGQTGLTFVAVAGSPAPPAQSIPVLNVGSGTMPWSVAVSTLSGGNWLSVTPQSGVTTGMAAAPAIQVTANPGGLAPGAYFGLVTVNAPSADNSPQSSVILLSILPADVRPGPSIVPNGLVFTTGVGGRPAAQEIQVINPGGGNSTVAVTTAFPSAQRWFTVTPANANLPSGGAARATVTPTTTGLAAGVYRGTINFRFTPDNLTRNAEILMIVTATSALGTASKVERDQSAACTPRSLQGVFRSPGGGFSVTAGWPTAIEMQILDDCGRNVDSGRAIVAISTNEPPVALTATGNGRWSGTWTARTARASGVGLAAQFDSENPRLSGRTQVTGGVRDNPEQPVIEKDGVVNLASLKRLDPIAIGSLIGVQGSRLAAQFGQVEEGALPLEIGDTRAIVAGRALALRSVAPGQVDAQVPIDLADNTIHQLIIQRGRSYSPPEAVLITSVAPAIFPADPASTQGRIWVQEADGSRRLADGARPARAGETIVLHAVGLGWTTRLLAAGSPAPESPLAHVSGEVTLTIGGRAATVSEAVLAPGLVGIYRVTAIVPEGLEASTSVPVILAVNGQEGPQVSIAVLH